MDWKTTSKSRSDTTRRIALRCSTVGSALPGGESIRVPIRSATCLTMRRSSSARSGFASRLTTQTMPTVAPASPSTGTPT